MDDNLFWLPDFCVSCVIKLVVDHSSFFGGIFAFLVGVFGERLLRHASTISSCFCLLRESISRAGLCLASWDFVLSPKDVKCSMCYEMR